MYPGGKKGSSSLPQRYKEHIQNHETFRVFPELGRFRRRRGRTVTQPESKIHIIGIGNDGLAGLTAHARELLGSADLVLGSEQALSLVPELTAERFRIGLDLQE